MLDDDERAVFRCCAVFASGFDLDSAVAVLDNWDEFTVLDLLDSLVHKSLLSADLGRARSRYHMLETIRQFAEEQLEESGSTDTIRRGHAEHFGRESEAMWDVWSSLSQLDAIDWVDTGSSPSCAPHSDGRQLATTSNSPPGSPAIQRCCRSYCSDSSR